MISSADNTRRVSAFVINMRSLLFLCLGIYVYVAHVWHFVLMLALLSLSLERPLGNACFFASENQALPHYQVNSTHCLVCFIKLVFLSYPAPSRPPSNLTLLSLGKDGLELRWKVGLIASVRLELA